MIGGFRRFSTAASRSFCASSFRQLPAISRRLPTQSTSKFLLASTAKRSFTHAVPRLQVAAPTTSHSQEPPTRFDDLASREMVHPNLIDAITQDMRLESMTEVQVKTINEALKGSDLVGQAKTGTGKTLAFLLPLMQRILDNAPDVASRRSRAKAEDCRSVIISPTRELAEQIAAEAKRLAQRTGIQVQLAVGGSQKSSMLERMHRQGCHLLIATPGRLQDILSDSYAGVQLPNVDSLVLDEADRLLDDGFLPAIEEIQRWLPDPKVLPRQTMLFSATIQPEIVHLVRQTLREGFKFVQCVRPDEEPTHERVPQRVVRIAGLENQLPAILELCQREIAEHKQAEKSPFKAIVFFSSTAEVEVTSEALHSLWSPGGGGILDGVRVYHIHGKLTQTQRTIAADRFRGAESAILVSSDVTARGMDFPNVTHVIQVGLPNNRESYIHRLGRTARAGKEGEGWLIISDVEQDVARKRLRDLPFEADRSLQTASADLSGGGEVPAQAAELIEVATKASKKVSPELLRKRYLAGLSVLRDSTNAQAALDSLNGLARYGWGMATPPGIPVNTARRLGITNMRGVVIADGRDSGFDGRGGDSGGRGRGFGGAGRGFGGAGRGFGGASRGYEGRDRSFGGRDSRGGGQDPFGRPGGTDRSRQW